MPKNKVSDPITDQEIAFARLVLNGAMTDRHAAEAVGLNPDSAAYTKAKPRVRAYMLEHRAAVQQQLVQQEAEGLHRLNLDREQVLNRLWEIANLSPDMTRNSITGQVKALSMIIAIEGLIPDRRTVSAKNESAPPQIDTAAWLREQQGKSTGPQPNPDLDEDGPARPGVPWGVPAPPPGAAADAPSDLGPAPDRTLDSSDPIFAHPFSPSGTTPSSPHARVPHSAADNRVPSSREKNPSTWRLRL
jgi:hypothetical protein